MPSTPGPSGRVHLLESYGRLPLSFEKNLGQTEAQVKYISRGRGYSLYLTPSEAVLSLTAGKAAARKEARPGQSLEARPTDPPAVVRMRLVDGNPNPEISGVEELPEKSHYFIGNDPTLWRTNVPRYARVSYRDVYPGVDLVYHGSQGRLEYDFVVSPRADPRPIRLRLEGPAAVRLDGGGNLVLQTREGQLVQHAPFVYQEVEGERRWVGGSYVLHGGSDVGFELGAYDSTRPLVIDPAIEYSTYLGGAGSDAAASIAVDSSGSAYVTGETASANFPTLNPYEVAQGDVDVFVTKLSPSGSSLAYSTYLGGSGRDIPHSIAVDASGSAYVAGVTFSTDFPTLDPYQTDQDGVLADAFVTKLSPSGSSLAYSTYLGGSDADGAFGIAVDGSGSTYLTGSTQSTDFPTLNAFQAYQGLNDVFVTKLAPAGSNLVYSTYLGTTGFESSFGIAIDGSGSAYVTGRTDSPDFPTLNPYQTHQGLNDVFLTKLAPSGSSLAYSTYLGGGAFDIGLGIVVDASGSAYVTGYTDSTNFPTLNPYQTNQGDTDAFVTKLSPSGSSLAYSTYLGGGNTDAAFGIAIDSSGSAHVTGRTLSTDFPTLTPYQTDLIGPDAFVTKLSPSGSSLTYSTYLGGGGDEQGAGITLDGSGSAYVTGSTSSTDFPTLSPYQSAQGGNDAFVTKLAPTFAFYTLSPCRVVDTRNASGPLGGPALICSSAPVPRTFPLGGACGLPPAAQVISYNVAVTQPMATGHLRLFPTGGLLPLVSSINYSAGATRANNGIVRLGAGSVNVSCHQSSGTAHVIIDINGYFE